jgi:MYXO-CTERM domain-containing protein
MNMLMTRLACVLLLGLFASAPAAADQRGNHHPGGNNGPPNSVKPGPPNGNHHGNKGAPAPVTGAGLPFLIAAGAFAAFRRRRSQP